MARGIWIGVAAVAGVALLSVMALAHRPVAIGGVYDGPAAAVTLADPDVSQVAYGDLLTARPSLWIAVRVAAAQDLYVQLGVPALERLRAFRPQLAIVGPGLPALSLPFAVPDAAGGVLVVTSSVADGVFFHEPVTDTDSWILGEATVRLPSAGTYYVVVWSSSIVDGKAWAAVGRREAFGWEDVLKLAETIEAVRAFHEVGRDARLITVRKVLFLAAAALVIARLARL